MRPAVGLRLGETGRGWGLREKAAGRGGGANRQDNRPFGPNDQG